MSGNTIFNLVIRVFLIITVIAAIFVLFFTGGCRAKGARPLETTPPAIAGETNPANE